MDLSQSGHFGEQLPSPQPSCYNNLNIPATRFQAIYDFKWLWYIMGFVNVSVSLSIQWKVRIRLHHEHMNCCPCS